MAIILATPNAPARDFGDLQPIVEALRIAGDISVSHPKFAKASAQVPAAAGGSISDVIAELKNAEKGPSGSTADKKAPPATTVCILPYDKNAALQNYDTLMDANSIVQLYTSLWTAARREQRGHPEPYDITVASEAAQAFADQASCAYDVMSEGLAGIFNFSGGLQNVMSRKMTKTDLHLEFLGEIFKGFNLGSAAKSVLDGVLTEFIKSIANFSVSTEKTKNTVDHSLRIVQCVKLNITGDKDDADAVYVYQPRVKIVYMRLNNDTYSWSTDKASHNESNFYMQYTIADFDLNVNKFKSSRDRLENVWNMMSDTNMREWSKKVTGNAVSEDQ